MRLSITAVTEAVVDIMREASLGGAVDHVLAARIAGQVRPGLEKALKGRPASGAELSALSEFRTVVGQHLASPQSAYIANETRRALERVLATANRSGSEFASAILYSGRVPLQADDGNLDSGGERRRSGERSVASLARETTLTVSGAVGFARELGINPVHAGFFSGTSADMQNALRDALRKGTAITDAHIKNPNDVAAVIGAIRAGKLAPNDPRVPQSVRDIMEDMKKNGVDPATAKPDAIKKYFRDHPGALDTVKKTNAKTLESVKAKTDEQLKAGNLAKTVAVAATKPGSKVNSAKL